MAVVPIFERDFHGDASLLGEEGPQEMMQGVDLIQDKWMGNEAVAQNQDQLAVYQRDELGGGEGDRLEAVEK